MSSVVVWVVMSKVDCCQIVLASSTTDLIEYFVATDLTEVADYFPMGWYVILGVVEMLLFEYRFAKALSTMDSFVFVVGTAQEAAGSTAEAVVVYYFAMA